MLTIARESKLLTQSELARILNITQGTISKAENNLVPASENLVAMYAEALGYPVAFFYQDHEPKNLPLTLYRKRARVTTKILKSMQARLNILLLHVKKLLKSVTIKENRIPRINIESYEKNGRLVAQELRIQWHQNGPIGNLTKLVEDAGALVISCDFGTKDVDGMSFYDADDPDALPPIIMINHQVPGDRLRFTLAHELAHVILHHHLPIVPQDCEREADEFAGEFLVPAALVRGFLRNVTLEKLAGLKQFWKVSMASLLRKAGELGCITERQQRFLWMKMGKAGYRTREPVPIPRDEPETIKQVFRYHLDHLGYTDLQLGELLGTTVNGLHHDYPYVQHGLRVVT